MRTIRDEDNSSLPAVSVSAGAWVTKPVGPVTTATVAAADLGLDSFKVGQKLIVESIGTLLVHAGPAGWSENWTNNRTTNPLERIVGTGILALQSSGDTLFLRDEGVTERGEPTSVTVSLPVEVRL